MKGKRQFVWPMVGKEKRKFVELRRPCECGCDFRQGKLGVGYLIFSNGKGNGATIWIEDEEIFQILKGSFINGSK